MIIGASSKFSKRDYEQISKSNDKGSVILLTGPNGSGKSTILKRLTSKSNNFSLLRHTSRKKGLHEVNGKDYLFVSPLKFILMVMNRQFLEWQKWPIGFYGTSKEVLLRQIQQGKRIVIDLDVNAALRMKKLLMLAGIPCFDILLSPVSHAALLTSAGVDEATEILEFRLRQRQRGESEKEIKYRLTIAREYYSKASRFSYVVCNGQGGLEQAIKDIEVVIR